MEAIFGGNLATRKFAMASNEPLGSPTNIGLDATEDLTDLGGTNADSGRGTLSVNGKQPSDDKGKEERGPKRRKMAQEELELMNGMIKVVEHVGDALKAP
jgi:hypothetical protein